MLGLATFLRDPYFWVQVLVAAGTLALAGVAFWDIHRRRQEEQARRFGTAIEMFLAPVMEQASALHELSQPRINPYRTGLDESARRLDDLLLHKLHQAYRVSPAMIQDIWYLQRVALDVAVQLKRLRVRESAVLDDVGSALSGEVGRREHPRVAVYQDGKALGEVAGVQLFEVWLKRMDFRDYLAFIFDAYNRRRPAEFKVHHGPRKVLDGPDAAELQQALFDRMKSEAEFQRLPARLDELRLEAEKAVQALSRLLKQHTDRARG